MRVLLVLVALLAFTGLARSNSAGKYGSVTVTTHLSPTTNDLTVTLTSTDANGNTVTTGPISVEADPNGDGLDVLNTDPANPISHNGKTIRWKNKKYQERQSNGSWKTIPKQKDGKRGNSEMEYLRVGQPAPTPGTLWRPDFSDSVDLVTGERAPFSGYFDMVGEEVTSLPSL